VRLPWQPLTPEEHGYERSASGFMVVCRAVKVPGVAMHHDLAVRCTRQRNSSIASHSLSHFPQSLHKLAELTTFAVP